MPSGKDRLYVGLYARGGAPTMPGLEDRYHWGLIVGPKKESGDSRGIKFHAKETICVVEGSSEPQSVWHYEEEEIPMAPTGMILVRIMIGKVTDKSRLRSIFEHTPIRPEVPGWNCVGWASEALMAAIRDDKALGTSANDWKVVRDAAMQYVEDKKAAHRFDGTVQYNQSRVPTWDLLQNAELTP